MEMGDKIENGNERWEISTRDEVENKNKGGEISIWDMNQLLIMMVGSK